MQNLYEDPIAMLGLLAGLAAFFVVLTYFGTGRLKVKGFSRPRWTTSIGMATFLFIGMTLGVFAVMAVYMGDFDIVGGEWLFNNTAVMVLLVAFVVSFLGSLSYLYIYRGGA